MSAWGFWGYVGIVVSLLALMSVLFVCLELMYRRGRAHTEDSQEAEQGSPKGRHAA